MKFALIAVAAVLVSAPAFAQDAPAAAAADAPKLPYCSAKVTDSCQQTAAQQARAMTGEQADKRDAKTGTWTPNKRATPAAPQPK
jgi:hypothetical protein